MTTPIKNESTPKYRDQSYSRQLRNHFERCTHDFWKSANTYLWSFSSKDLEQIHNKAKPIFNKTLVPLVIKPAGIAFKGAKKIAKISLCLLMLPKKVILLPRKLLKEYIFKNKNDEQTARILKGQEKLNQNNDEFSTIDPAISPIEENNPIEDSFEAIDQHEPDEETFNDRNQRAQEALPLKRKLTNATVLTLMENLQLSHHEFAYIDAGLLETSDASLFTSEESFPDLKISSNATLKTVSKIAIPLILNGSLGKHIVLVMVDTNTHSIKYFDSKGLTVRDRKNSHLLDGTTLEDTVNGIWKHYATSDLKNSWTFDENTEKVQKDSHTCGLQVFRRIEESLDTKNTITDKISFPKNQKEAVYRAFLIQDLISNVSH